MALVERQGHEFDSVNCATALQRSAKLDGTARELKSGPQWRKPAQGRVRLQLPQLKPHNLATASWASARLQLADRELLQALGETVQNQLAECGTRPLSRIVWGRGT
eukprot:s3260_g2.t2